jgi:hypothetical protein
MTSVCDYQRVKYFMGFKYDWNMEIIAQFHATVHFSHWRRERTMFWMINERKLCITFSNFLALFKIVAPN